MIVQHERHLKNWSVPVTDVVPEHSCDDPIVICGVTINTPGTDDNDVLIRQLMARLAESCRANTAGREHRFDRRRSRKLGFPPSDLSHTTAQQLLVMELIRRQIKKAGDFDPLTTAVFVGMGLDMDICRYNMRTPPGAVDGLLAKLTRPC